MLGGVGVPGMSVNFKNYFRVSVWGFTGSKMGKQRDRWEMFHAPMLIKLNKTGLLG